MGKRMFILILVLSFLFSCGTVNHGFYNNVELEEGEYVTLYLDGTVQVRSFDGVDGGGGRALWRSSFNGDHFVKIPPGHHNFMLYYFLNQAQYGYTKSSDIPFEYDFLRGKTYRIYPSIENNKVQFLIEEYQPKK